MLFRSSVTTKSVFETMQTDCGPKSLRAYAMSRESMRISFRQFGACKFNFKGIQTPEDFVLIHFLKKITLFLLIKAF